MHFVSVCSDRGEHSTSINKREGRRAARCGAWVKKRRMSTMHDELTRRACLYTTSTMTTTPFFQSDINGRVRACTCTQTHIAPVINVVARATVSETNLCTWMSRSRRRPRAYVCLRKLAARQTADGGDEQTNKRYVRA